MTETHLFQRTLHGLVPDAVNAGVLDDVPIGTIVSVTIKRPRNVLHHRKLFALISVVYPHQSTWLFREDLRESLLIAAGHCETAKALITDPVTQKRVVGEVWKAKSISFKALDQKGFEAVYDRIVHIILERILKGVARADLDREVEGILIGRR
jgi:hypothetical protein